jgi:hypothetical protein
MMTDGVTTQASGLSGLACKADAQREFPNSRIGPKPLGSRRLQLGRTLRLP